MPNVHTLHNQVHIVVGGAMGDVSSASNDPIFPLHHSFVDRIRLRNGFASSTRALRFLEHTMHALDTTKMTSLYHFMLCILINRFLRSLSIEFGYDYDDVDENGKYTWSFYLTLIYFSFTLNAILCNCNVALWGKKKIVSRTPLYRHPPLIPDSFLFSGESSFFPFNHLHLLVKLHVQCWILAPNIQIYEFLSGDWERQQCPLSSEYALLF